MTFDHNASQLLFLWSVIAGVALGAVFDGFRLIRVFGLKGRFSVFVQDVLFCILSALVYILLLFNFSDGALRFYSFLSMATGFLLWHVTLGALFMRLVLLIKAVLKELFAKVRDKISASIEKRRSERAKKLELKRANDVSEEGRTHGKKNGRKHDA